MRDFYVAHSDVKILLEDYQKLLKKGDNDANFKKRRRSRKECRKFKKQFYIM